MKLDYFETELLTSMINKLREKKYTITAAESCTAGLFCATVADIPGASDVLKEGYVTYSNTAKEKLVKVSAQSLETYGAVSEQVAYEMACGAAEVSGADVAVSVTGVAGPGPSDGKPEGLVYIGVFCRGRIHIEECNFEGNRTKIREQSVLTALSLVWNMICD